MPIKYTYELLVEAARASVSYDETALRRNAMPAAEIQRRARRGKGRIHA
ncbi:MULTISPECIES: hypothetical protein [Streptomyces]